jgi:putative ABC transport system permease protein
MKFISNKDMGFKKDQLLVVDINSGKVRRAAGTIKAELLKMSAVKAVSASSRVPGEWKDLPKLKVKKDHLHNVAGEDMYFLGVDDQFLQTYQIGLVEGRNFMAGSISDSSSAMINETAAKMLGIAQASGQILTIPMDQPFQAKVVGIVKDFNFQSLREPLAPMILGFQNNPLQSIDYFTIRVSTDAMAATLDQMNKILQGIDKNHLFEYHFLDQQWSLFYQDDHIREIIFMIVAVLTILIACLGLLGLATYAAEQRIKEIGIRKVLGASVTGIVAMLSKDFLKLVLIAALIAIPVAGWAMHSWLQGYAYRIDISWWIFFAATLLALLIAFCTISFQAIKAAIANPVQSLRSE